MRSLWARGFLTLPAPTAVGVVPIIYAQRSAARPVMGAIAQLSTRPVARKGRGVTAPTGTGAQGPDAPLSFINQGRACFKEIHDAVQDMKALNQVFDITAQELELKIDVGSKGNFVFVIKPRGETLQYHSPVSGVLEYKFDPEERLWLQVDDKHDFRGMLTRDMIRVCIGYPKFK